MTLYFDVLPFIGLLLFHYKNFKQIKHLPEEQDESLNEEQNESLNDLEEVVYLEPNSTLSESKIKSRASSQPSPLKESSDILCQSILGASLDVYIS